VFTHATIGRGVVFAVDSSKKIYRGSLAAVGGRLKYYFTEPPVKLVNIFSNVLG
jgi:hypothetical protein